MSDEIPLKAIEGADTTFSVGQPDYKVISVKHPGRFIASVLALLVLATIFKSLATNPNWEWSVMAEYFSIPSVLKGLGLTLFLAGITIVLGFVFGTFIALARLSKSPVLSNIAGLYIWFFRSVPLLVLLVIIYNWAYLYQYFTVGIPLTSIVFFRIKTIVVLSPITTAIIGLSLNEAAFSAENIRGGILSVDQGQIEAAASLGIGPSRRLVKIILPQAMRSIIPNGFNSFIGLVKGTSIVYVLAINELFHTVQVIYNRTQRVVPMLMVAVGWYLIITTFLSIIQYYIERYFAKGAQRNLPPTPLERIRKAIVGFAAKFVNKPSFVAGENS